MGYVTQTALPKNIVRNKIFSDRDHEDIDRKNHRIITERLYLAMIALHYETNNPLDVSEVNSYADKAMELATIFDSAYKKHYITRLDFKDFVRASEMSYEERGEGTMRYEAEKRYRNEHATMTYSHYEAMICSCLKKFPNDKISQEDAEIWVESAGKIVTMLQERYGEMYLKPILEDEMEVA